MNAPTNRPPVRPGAPPAPRPGAPAPRPGGFAPAARPPAGPVPAAGPPPRLAPGPAGFQPQARTAPTAAPAPGPRPGGFAPQPRGPAAPAGRAPAPVAPRPGAPAPIGRSAPPARAGRTARGPQLPTDFMAEGRLAFQHLITPEIDQYGKEKWSTVMLLPPTTNFDPIVTALNNALINQFGDDSSLWPNGRNDRTNIGDIIRPADENADKWEGYERGWYFFGAIARRPPMIVGAARGADGKFPVITDPNEVYSGRWVMGDFNAFTYTDPNKGASVGINSIQLRRHDKNLGSGAPDPNTRYDDYTEELGTAPAPAAAEDGPYVDPESGLAWDEANQAWYDPATGEWVDDTSGNSAPY